MIERIDTSIPDIAAFAAVAQTGSFTKAAEGLGSSKSNIGKAVQRLEARLGTKLFQRTTRAVRQRYPKVTLELALTDRMFDPVAEGWDIVVRIGELPQDGDMTARKLCDLRFGLYASPEYLTRRGPVNAVSELASHDAIVFRGSTGRLRPWTLLDNGFVRDIAMDPVMVMSDGQVLIEATVHGMGITQILDRVAQPYVEAGKLVHVLPGADVDDPPVHALIPLGQRMGAKTRAVLNHLADSLRSRSS